MNFAIAALDSDGGDDDRPVDVIRMNATAQAHVDAYLEYRAIVGSADGGVMLSEAEYAAFRARAIEARKNRIYVCWRNMSTGMDCKNIGPESKCFCKHRYREHATDNWESRRVHCRAKGCKCALFLYIPVHGGQDFKCHCKHSFTEHDITGMRMCQRANCRCNGFSSSFACSCGQFFGDHETVFESRAEREAAGRPVDNLGGGGLGYEAMGGITNFSSLIDGADRLPPDYWTDGAGKQILEAEEAERAAAAGFGARKPQPRALEAPQSQPIAQHSSSSTSYAGNRGDGSGGKAAMPTRAQFEQGAKVPVGKFQAQVAAFDSNLVEIGGTFMPIKGKMTADQEFAIYDQKYQKSSKTSTGLKPRAPAPLASAGAMALQSRGPATSSSSAYAASAAADAYGGGASSYSSSASSVYASAAAAATASPPPMTTSQARAQNSYTQSQHHPPQQQYQSQQQYYQATPQHQQQRAAPMQPQSQHQYASAQPSHAAYSSSSSSSAAAPAPGLVPTSSLRLLKQRIATGTTSAPPSARSSLSSASASADAGGFDAYVDTADGYGRSTGQYRSAPPQPQPQPQYNQAQAYAAPAASRPPASNYYEEADDVVAQMDSRIATLEHQLTDPALPATKQFALKRQLQMEKAARIRELRKQQQ